MTWYSPMSLPCATSISWTGLRSLMVEKSTWSRLLYWKTGCWITLDGPCAGVKTHDRDFCRSLIGGARFEEQSTQFDRSNEGDPDDTEVGQVCHYAAKSTQKLTVGRPHPTRGT